MGKSYENKVCHHTTQSFCSLWYRLLGYIGRHNIYIHILNVILFIIHLWWIYCDLMVDKINSADVIGLFDYTSTMSTCNTVLFKDFFVPHL